LVCKTEKNTFSTRASELRTKGSVIGFGFGPWVHVHGVDFGNGSWILGLGHWALLLRYKL
jgi:hypothetical protein